MYINRETGDFVRAAVYPHIDDHAQAADADLIKILPDGRVLWRGDFWTMEEVQQYIAQLSSAFAVAFKIAQEDEQ